MKEPPTQHHASKIKLVCSFNGYLAPTPPNNILRYVGGETRIITIHRRITFYELHSKISLLCPGVSPFSLKYKLPTLSNRKKIETLVSLVSDDDVRCMIEEFDVAEELGMCSRLWVFVFREESFGFVNIHCNEIGFRNNGLSGNKRSLFVNGVRDCDNCNNGFVVKSLSRHRNPRDEHGNWCGKNGVINGVRVDGDDERTRRGFKNGELVRKPVSVSGVEGNEIGKKTKFDGDSRYYYHPLIDLASQQCGLLGGEGVNGTVLNGTQQSGCHIQDPRLCPLSPNDGNLRVQPNNSLHINLQQYDNGQGKGTLRMDVISGQTNGFVHDQKQLPRYGHSFLSNNPDGKHVESALDRRINGENILPQAADHILISRDLPGTASLLDSSPLSGRALAGPHNNILYHRFSINDAKYHSGYPHSVRSNTTEVGNYRAVGLDGRLSGLRSSLGLKPNANISKQGQAVRLNHPQYMKPWLNSYNHSLKGLLRNVNSGAHNQKELGNVAASPFQDAYAGVRDETVLPSKAISQTNDNVGNVKKDLLAGCKDIKGSLICQIQYELFRSALSCAPVWSGSREKVNGINQQENFDTKLQKMDPPEDLSIHNLSLTSPKEVEPPVLSSASSDVSDGLTKTHAKSIDLMEFSSGPKDSEHNGVYSLAVTRGEDNRPCEEEAPREQSTFESIGKNEEIAKCQNSSKVTGGISSYRASFCTQLATRELQTIKSSELEYVKELGSGTYGTVYHGKWNGSDVAVKKLKASCFTDGEVEGDRLVDDFWREAHMLGQLHHPNIVAFYGVVTDGPLTSLATVTEYMVNGSLKQVLRRKDRTIDRRKRLIIAMDASFGMEYLHGKNIVHFDLKSHNFLVNMRDPQRPVCKIGDLGLSKMKKRTLVSGGLRGTIPWMAPELFSSKDNMVTEKVDVYSFGIVMWELLTGEEPYGKMHSEDIIAGIIKGDLRPDIPSWCDPAWRSLMERCWSTDPNLRPSFSEIAKELRTMAAAMNIK